VALECFVDELCEVFEERKFACKINENKFKQNYNAKLKIK